VAKVVAPITARVEVIGRPKESSYEAGKFYYPTLFIDLSQPEGSEAAKIWKNLSDDEVSQFQKGDQVQLVPAGKDKSGKDKHNILLLEPQDSVPTCQSKTAPTDERWSAERKREIACYLESQLALLAYCDKQARQTFDGLPEQTLQKYSVTLFLAAQKKFGL
jgi:hypothetical protein